MKEKFNEKKEEELADLKAKAQSATAAQMSSLSDANKSMESTAWKTDPLKNYRKQ